MSSQIIDPRRVDLKIVYNVRYIFQKFPDRFLIPKFVDITYDTKIRRSEPSLNYGC
jgi:hypothetical protein